MRIAALACVGVLAVACAGSDDAVEVPTPASDEERIAFSSSRDGDFEIYTMRPDGSDVRQLTRNEETESSDKGDERPMWSPDGQWIAFMSSRDHERGGVTSEEVYVMRADGSGEKRLTENSDADLLTGWSEDGEIVFWQCRDSIADCELHRIGPDGTGDDVVFETDEVVVQSDGVYAGEVFARILSRDARSLRGGELVAIGVESGEDRKREEGIPSPDGDGRLLVATDRDRNGRCLFHDCVGYAAELYVDDRRLTRTTHQEGGAVWSPGGERIVFARIANEDDDFELWVMNADGSCQTQLTNNEEWDWAPNWIGPPDADRPLDC